METVNPAVHVRRADVHVCVMGCGFNQSTENGGDIQKESQINGFVMWPGSGTAVLLIHV